MNSNILKEIPEEYKKSEIGLIPKDWEAKKIKDIGDLTMGQSPPGNSYTTDEKYYPLINGAIELKESGIFIYKYTSKPTRFAEIGDLIFCIRATIGNLQISDQRYCLGRDVASLRVKDHINKFYIIYQLNNLFKKMQQQSEGGVIRGLKKNDLADFDISLPNSKYEQTTIAKVLYDTDALIESLEKLITKKKAIKQGAMQQLLNGKKRLPGFTGEWKTKKLGEIVGRITTGKLDANAMRENGEYRFYTCAKKYYYIDNYAFDTEALIVSGNGANVGYIHYFKGKFNAYQRTYVLYDFLEDISFTKLFMDRNLQERIRVEVNAGNTPYITMNTLSEMSIKLPPTLEEQTTIANILSDMDSEIEKLEKKRDKYILLKQGMMQQLLTGKIRLVKNGDN